ncbi:hypothetical protein D3C72_2259210 [compost metagenome]
MRSSRNSTKSATPRPKIRPKRAARLTVRLKLLAEGTAMLASSTMRTLPRFMASVMRTSCSRLRKIS